MKGLGQVRLRQGGAVAVTHDVERAGQVVVQALKDRLVGAIAELIPHVGVGHDEPSVLVAVRQQVYLERAMERRGGGGREAGSGAPGEAEQEKREHERDSWEGGGRRWRRLGGLAWERPRFVTSRSGPIQPGTTDYGLTVLYSLAMAHTYCTFVDP